MLIEKKVVQNLNNGLSREQVLEELRGQDDDDEIIYFTNCYATLADKKQYMVFNLVLVFLLVYVTARKVLEVTGYGFIDFTAMAAMVVPIVNVYLIQKLLKFHKNGYKFVFILTILSLVHKENHSGVAMIINLILIALSCFLYMKIFSKGKMLPEVD